MNIAEFRSRSKRRNASPEHDLQCEIVKWLQTMEFLGRLNLFDWTANAAGVRVTPRVAKKMKESGVRAGWPDLQFLLLDGRTAYIELKAKQSLSPAQRLFRDFASAKGLWALARSVADVERTLIAWGVIDPDPAAQMAEAA